jgi:hypothetical protein
MPIRPLGASSSTAVVLTPTAVKSGNYTAVAGDFVPVDATAASRTVTLPTAPANGTGIAVKMIAVGTGFTTSIACGGSDVFNKSGGSTTLTLTLVNQAMQLEYWSGIWYVLSDDLTLGGLDTRYLTGVTAAGNLGSAYTLALASRANVAITGTLTADPTTITVTGLAAGASARLELTQNATGGNRLVITDGVTPQKVPVSPKALGTTEVTIFSPDGSSIIAVGAGPSFASYNIPGLLAPPGISPTLVTNAASGGTANRSYWCRLVASSSGWVRHLGAYVGVSAGNVDIGLWTPTSTRVKVWRSGSIAVPAAGWKIISDPGDGVVWLEAGEILDATITVSDGTAQFGRAGASGQPSLGIDLPTEWGFQSTGSGRAYGRADVGAPGAVGTAPGGGAAGDVGSTVAEGSITTSGLTPWVVFGTILP